MKGRVYRCYDAADRLLYIGATMQRVEQRLQQHRYALATNGKSQWVTGLARVEVDEYPTWQEAEAAEVALIHVLQPPHNVHGKTGSLVNSASVKTLRAMRAAS